VIASIEDWKFIGVLREEKRKEKKETKYESLEGKAES
jgi:hypothetical protein